MCEKMEKYADKGITGLANLGNTCFINSTLQCLSHTYELNNLLNKKEYIKNLNKKIPDTQILCEWDELRELMWSENCTIHPGKFINAVHTLATKKDREIFTGFAQNDLPEFLLFIIDCFHNAISRKVNMQITGLPEDSKDNLAIKCYKMMITMYKQIIQKLTNYFGVFMYLKYHYINLIKL